MSIFEHYSYLFWSSCFFFFFKQKTAYEMRISDWSSDVCSSDLGDRLRQFQPLEKPTDDAHGKSVTRTNRIDHTINRAGRHAPLLRSIVEISTLCTQLEHDQAGPAIQIKIGDF